MTELNAKSNEEIGVFRKSCLLKSVLISLSLLSVLFINGCQTSPPPLSTINIPKHWPFHPVSLNKEVNLAQLKWWEQFKNPELNSLIQKTLTQNNELRIALAKTEQAQSQLEQIKLSWVPVLNYVAGYSQFPDIGNPGAIAMAYPTYIINLLQLYQQQKNAKALYQASIEAQEGVKVALLARTAMTYFVLLQQIEALTLYQKLNQDAQTYLQTMQTQFQSGLIAQDNLVEQQSKIHLIESQIQIIQYNILVSKNLLHYLSDENPGTIDIKIPFKQISSDAIIPANQPLSVLSNRPDIRQAEALLKAAHADTKAIQASFFPQIKMGAYLGTTSEGRLKLGQAYLNGPLIDLPLLAQIKGAKARDQELYWHYRDRVRAALRDVSNDLIAYSAYSNQLRSNKQALKEAKNQCHLVAIRFKHGLEDASNPIKCTLAVDELALTINQNKLEKIRALIILYQDLGGGYDGA